MVVTAYAHGRDLQVAARLLGPLRERFDRHPLVEQTEVLILPGESYLVAAVPREEAVEAQEALSTIVDDYKRAGHRVVGPSHSILPVVVVSLRGGAPALDDATDELVRAVGAMGGGRQVEVMGRAREELEVRLHPDATDRVSLYDVRRVLERASTRSANDVEQLAALPVGEHTTLGDVAEIETVSVRIGPELRSNGEPTALVVVHVGGLDQRTAAEVESVLRGHPTVATSWLLLGYGGTSDEALIPRIRRFHERVEALVGDTAPSH